MQITKRTRTKDMLPLLNEERLSYVLENIEPYPLEKKVIDMTIGEFLETMDADYSLRFLEEKRAYKAFGMMRSFRDEVEQVAKLIEKFSVGMEDDERQAMRGIDFPTAKERILLDTREWFGLRCLEGDGKRYGATDVPLAEYILMLKDKSATARFERNRAKLQERKLKANGKH